MKTGTSAQREILSVSQTSRKRTKGNFETFCKPTHNFQTKSNASEGLPCVRKAACKTSSNHTKKVILASSADFFRLHGDGRPCFMHSWSVLFGCNSNFEPCVLSASACTLSTSFQASNKCIISSEGKLFFGHRFLNCTIVLPSFLWYGNLPHTELFACTHLDLSPEAFGDFRSL